MPTWWGVTGSAVASRTETALVSGTATVRATPSVYVSGTATVDRTSLAAWAARLRRTTTRVFLGDAAEDMLRIQGDASVDIGADSPVATASFRLTDPRCAYAASGSIARGGVPVSIRCRIATEEADAETTVFRGITEAAPNEGAFAPTAQIQCAGEGAEWLLEKGCLALAAFSGTTRLALLQAFAASVGVDSSRILGGSGSKTLYLPLDLSGLSIWTMAQRLARLEDWYLRNSGGDLELIPARQVVGPDASSVFAFEPSTYFSVAETPPNRPVSRLVLSTVGIPSEILTGGTEETTSEIKGGTLADGTRWETVILTTTVNGAVIRQRIEESRDAAIPGVTPSAVAWRLWKLTVTESTWGTVTVGGVALRTGRLNSQRTTVTEWYSPPCQTAGGSVWSDGSRHLDASASWQVTDDRISTFTYDAAPSCLLTSKVTNVGGWYSEIVDSGYAYDDGKQRADTAYQWIAPTATQPVQRLTETYAEETTATEKAVTSDYTEARWYAPPGLVAETWGEASGSNTRWSTVPGSGIVTTATLTFHDDGSSEYDSKSAAGELPVLARAADDVPQYKTVPLVLTATADSSNAAVEPRIETVWGAEDMDDLTTVARRTFRDAQSPSVTILHRAMPLLQLYDVVTVTDPTRALDTAKGYVASIRLLLDSSTTGRLNQETVVVFPLSQFDPEAA